MGVLFRGKKHEGGIATSARVQPSTFKQNACHNPSRNSSTFAQDARQTQGIVTTHVLECGGSLGTRYKFVASPWFRG